MKYVKLSTTQQTALEDLLSKSFPVEPWKIMKERSYKALLRLGVIDSNKITTYGIQSLVYSHLIDYEGPGVHETIHGFLTDYQRLYNQ